MHINIVLLLLIQKINITILFWFLLCFSFSRNEERKEGHFPCGKKINDNLQQHNTDDNTIGTRLRGIIDYRKRDKRFTKEKRKERCDESFGVVVRITGTGWIRGNWCRTPLSLQHVYAKNFHTHPLHWKEWGFSDLLASFIHPWIYRCIDTSSVLNRIFVYINIYIYMYNFYLKYTFQGGKPFA